MKSNLSDDQVAKLENSIFTTVAEVLEDGTPIYQIDYIEGMGLNAIWGFFDNPAANMMLKTPSSFEERREAFLWVLEHLLHEGRIKLHKNGILLSGAVDEHIAAFRRAWPENELAADKISYLPGSEYIGSGGGMSLWFFMNECPGEAAWRQNDGTYNPC